MSVRVKMLGRLGNNLFQYALGRIIAERHGLELDCEQCRPVASLTDPGLDSGSSATLEDLACYFPNAPLRIPGKRVETPSESYEVKSGQDWNGQTIDLPAILADETPRQIRLAGYFQRYQYFASYEGPIRQWFRLNPLTVPFQIRPNDVLINVRRGADYGILGWTLPISYYDRVLSGLADPGKVFICGTGIDDPVRRHFEKYDPVYYSAAPMEEFFFITCFNRIILSNSTFAWWAAYLSQAQEVYAPRAAHSNCYGFTGYQDVDLHMQHPRYREVENASVAEFALFRRKTNLPSVRLDSARNTLRVEREVGDFVTIDLDDDNRDVLEWLLRQQGPITLANIRERYRRADLGTMIRQLVDSGLLSIEPRYFDTNEDLAIGNGI